MGKFESFNHAKDGYEHHNNIAKTMSEMNGRTLGPLTVQWTAIFSFLLIPKDLTV